MPVKTVEVSVGEIQGTSRSRHWLLYPSSPGTYRAGTFMREKQMKPIIENIRGNLPKKQGKPLKSSGATRKRRTHFFVRAAPVFFFPVAFTAFFSGTAFTSQGKHFSSRSSMTR